MKQTNAIFTYVVIALAWLISQTTLAQKKFKYGDVTKDDLTMTVYPTDTSANAAILHEMREVDLRVDGRSIVGLTQYSVRIKILKPEGLHYANPTILYQTSGYTESVGAITAFTYNFNPEKGKIEKVKLDKQYIVDENVGGSFNVKKLSLQNVKVGSVIEYGYEISRPISISFQDVTFQRDIPVRYSCYQTSIPEFFTISKNTLGYEQVHYKEKQETLNIALGLGTGVSKNMVFEVNELPALKGDNHTWNYRDFLTRVKLELTAVHFPGGIVQDFSSNWKKVDEKLWEMEGFGKQLYLKGLLKDEVEAIKKRDTTDVYKVEQLVALVKEKVKWNGSTPLTIGNSRKALKEGKGSSAEMNAILISICDEAGYKAYPVVMSVKSRGRILTVNPTIENLSYFIACVEINGQAYYVDASTKYGGLNALSIDCLVDNARILKKQPEFSDWVDLQYIQRNRIIDNILIGFNEKGQLSGHYQTIRTGVEHQLFSTGFEAENAQSKYKEQVEKNNDMKIESFALTGNTLGSTSTKLSYDFNKTENALETDIIYLNPILFPFLSESPFKAETRKLPIEFKYPMEFRQSVVFTIPQGYKIETIPQMEKVALPDNSLVFAYVVKATNDELHINQIVSLNRTIYSPEEYDQLREAYGKIVHKNMEQIVLKKIKP